METFIARQPIFSSDKTLQGYELLYRDGNTAAFNRLVDGNEATCSLISEAMFTFNLKTLSNGKKTFVNFTQDLLMCYAPLLLDPNQFIIEVLESVELDEKLVKRLSVLKKSGFQLALDDYVGKPISDTALEYLDIIKVDFRQVDGREQRAIAREMLKRGKILLAEKVETREEYEQAMAWGYTLFQGYYFEKPVVLTRHAMNIAPSSYLRLLQETGEADIDFDRIAEVVRVDVHLTCKLLKAANTVRYYYGLRVKSVKQALVLMGANEVRRWAMLVLMKNILADGVDELIRTALVRAVFCEDLSRELGYRCGNYAFCAGLFSIFDSQSEGLGEVLECLQNPEIITQALAGEGLLGEVLQIAREYEAMDLAHIHEKVLTLYPGLPMQRLSEFYRGAVQYADRVLDLPEKPGSAGMSFGVS